MNALDIAQLNERITKQSSPGEKKNQYFQSIEVFGDSLWVCVSVCVCSNKWKNTQGPNIHKFGIHILHPERNIIYKVMKIKHFTKDKPSLVVNQHPVTSVSLTCK